MLTHLSSSSHPHSVTTFTPRHPPRSHIYRQPVYCSAATKKERLLDKFWLARGVVDDNQRRQLVQIGSTISPDILDIDSQQLTEEDVLTSSSVSLPGVTSTWFLTTTAATTATTITTTASTNMYTTLAPEALPVVVSTSKRLLALESLLGGNGDLDVDVAWMVEREPALLTADPRAVANRLLELRIATEETADNVIQLIESQPALLLGNGCISREEGAEDKALAWR